MTRILGPTGSGRRRRALFGAVSAAVLVLALMPPAQADLNRSLFELDKNAQDDVTTFRDIIPPIVSGPLGVLNAAVSVSSTSIQVCQFANNDGTFLDPTGQTILIDAERIEVGGFTTASGGGCPSGSTKRNYTLLIRTSPAAHSNGERVTRLTFDEVAGADWDTVVDAINGGDDTCTTIGAVECAYAHDDRATSIFTSSKDYDDIEDWQWRDQAVPDADELDDGFAVKYVDGDGDQQLYFGADRAATNGSKDMGFWFFHDSVATVDPVGSADGTFEGSHTEPVAGVSSGDILILSTFTNGGAVTTIRVFEWVGPGGSTAALATRGNAGDCVPGNTTDDLCATVNDTTVESPWNYIGKGEPVGNEISAGGFLEGGVNLSDLGLEGCFSSFMATSRSSPSLTADPKDFILGNFESCGATVKTTPGDGLGEDLTDTDDPANGLVDTQLGTGAAGVDVTDSALLEVTGTTDFEGTLSFFICGPIDDPALCDTGGVPSGSQTVTANGTYSSDVVNLTSIGRYCWRAEFTSETPGLEEGASDSSVTECFEVKPVTPDLATQAVDAAGANQTDPVPFGDPVYDKASLSNTANEPGDDGGFNGAYTSINATNGAEADGTITFELKGPDGATTDCTTTALSDDATEENPQDVTVDSGDGDYFSAGFTPNLPGVYHWIASYSGSTSGNTTSTDHNTDCSDTGEDVTVQQLQPTMDTEQSFIPNDSATITVAAGTGALDGEVNFYLWVDDATCGAGDLGTADQTFGPLDVDAADVGTDPLSDTVETANSTAYGDDGTTFHWIAVFTSNNGAHLGVTSGCGNEHSSITIDNGLTQPQST